MNIIEKARIAGKINRGAIEHGFGLVTIGMSLLELDHILEKYIIDYGGIPAFKGYKGFPGASCLSVNNVAVHGVPNNYIIKENDLLTIDIGTIYNGIYADAAETCLIGTYEFADTQNATMLMLHTKTILELQTEILKPGVSLLDIAKIAEKYCEIYKVNIIAELGGHYIGEKLHMEPFIPSAIDYKKGTLNASLQMEKYARHKLCENDIICLEPVATFGDTSISLDPDGWTCRTKDTSAHFENTILITQNGYEILS